MPQLNPQFFLTQLFWLILAFTAIYAFVSVYFIPRASKIVEKRKDKITTDLLEAEKLIEKYKRTKIKSDEFLENTKLEAMKIKDNMVKKTEINLVEHIKKVDKEMASKLLLEEERLNQIKNRVSEQIPQIARELSKEIHKIIVNVKELNTKSAN